MSVMLTPTINHSKIQKLLGELGYNDSNWEYVSNFDYSLINWHKSLNNNARIVSLDRELVLDYAVRIDNGEVLPLPWIVQDTNGEFYIISGNHTLKALTEVLEQKSGPVYILKNINVKKLMLTAKIANRDHGKKEDRDADLRIAARNILEGNITHDEAEIAFGLRKVQIDNTIKTLFIEDKLVALPGGIKFLEKISRTRLTDACAAIKSDAVLVEYLGYVADLNPSNNDLKELLREIRAENLDSEKIQVIKDARANYVPTKKKGTSSVAPSGVYGQLTRSSEMFAKAITWRGYLGLFDYMDDERREELKNHIENMKRAIRVVEADLNK